LLDAVSSIDDVNEKAGFGVKAMAELDGRACRIAAGNLKLMAEEGIEPFSGEAAPAGTVVHVAVDGSYAGYILIADQLKPDAEETVTGLKAQGVQTVMLTGDSREAAHAVAQKLGIGRVDSQLLPGDKVEKVEELLAGLENGRESGAKHRGRLVFVGDGINDAPVLARADVGIAMGGLGSDAAIEAADIVIMNDEPSKIPLIMEISRKTMRIVRQNIIFALGIKLLVLALSAVGYANMWMAVFADVGVSVLAIINSFRAMGVKEK
jgi:Cd2+/Zn2+-exporting ATPase